MCQNLTLLSEFVHCSLVSVMFQYTCIVVFQCSINIINRNDVINGREDRTVNDNSDRI